ncbi:hypothetical protein CRM22_008219 [Opisthorchis felineus]|uniref:Uncharacterized protein n=1 Tax=Opisthorchis felineus TaxID=147828 RepID=A0A4S2LKJ1_OPIFE|nr:hypothetical protein CRM22_008219 [Opisthorchis felineus]
MSHLAYSSRLPTDTFYGIVQLALLLLLLPYAREHDIANKRYAKFFLSCANLHFPTWDYSLQPSHIEPVYLMNDLHLIVGIKPGVFQMDFKHRNYLPGECNSVVFRQILFRASEITRLPDAHPPLVCVSVFVLRFILFLLNGGHRQI